MTMPSANSGHIFRHTWSSVFT